MENKLLLIGTLGVLFMATTNSLVSDMHGMGSSFITCMVIKNFGVILMGTGLLQEA